MQFLVIFLVYALAVGHAEECNEERAEACVDTLLSSILGDTTEEEVCKELKDSIDCLRNAVDECISEKDDEVEEGLQELEKVLRDNCKADDDEQEGGEDAEMQKCFEENEEYIYECIYEGSTRALSLIIESGEEIDENALQCHMYGFMTACFVERIAEKCGQKAAELAEQEMTDVPKDIEEACEAASGIESLSFELLDRKRK